MLQEDILTTALWLGMRGGVCDNTAHVVNAAVIILNTNLHGGARLRGSMVCTNQQQMVFTHGHALKTCG